MNNNQINILAFTNPSLFKEQTPNALLHPTPIKVHIATRCLSGIIEQTNFIARKNF